MPLPQNCIWYRPQFHFNQVPPFSKCSRECDGIYWVAGSYIQSQDQQVRLSVRIRQRGVIGSVVKRVQWSSHIPETCTRKRCSRARKAYYLYSETAAYIW